ncbi:MAG: arginine--tRNA ligase [Halieaceae bacterium]|nr:arginine--tRNA ligase [Halieaceae bacterium]RZO80149.1 MAG: arginine--tRNA ligase [Halieaceae bacterium]
MKPELAALINTALEQLVSQGVLAGLPDAALQIDRPKDPSLGDLSCNIAMVLAKRAGIAPRDLATQIIDTLPDNTLIERCDIAGPGFINFFVNASHHTGVVRTILESGSAYGKSNSGAGRQVQVEFVSANPTGPLHVGHGRGAAIGDSLSRLLEATGWSVQREFYYNDAGQQINNLALSVQARGQGKGPDHPDWPADGYQGGYIEDVAAAYIAGDSVQAADREITGAADLDDLDAIREFAVACLRREQDQDLQAFQVVFDEYFLESSLYDSGAVEETVATLQAAGHTFEDQDALWLRTTDFGDDKDRVMRKSEGGYTYFVPDVAYHHNKWQRGYQRVINEQGADHHSTITRVRAGLQGLNVAIPEGWPEYVLHQMVTVMREGAEVKLSKRTGGYVTLRDLIDWVGCDATRYFLVARAPTSQLTFDVDLALARSNENPVYYIQYAHARCVSVLRKAAEIEGDAHVSAGLAYLARLDEPETLSLAVSLGRFPEVVANAAERLEPHDVANYLRELAAHFHSFYNAHKVLEGAPETMQARLALVAATRQVIASGLDLLGVSAPDAM